ncbi:MAG: alpha/beta hydrolase [Rubrivivax sp.]|nr:alpha/beta hydrolase [Rubrivivax sp.]
MIETAKRLSRQPARELASDLRGASRLAVDATLGLTDLVENLHHNILRTPWPLGEATQQPTRGLTGLVYRSIRGVTRLVGGSLDALLGQLVSLLGAPQAPGSVPPSPGERAALIAVLNGVLGDHLAATGNPLTIAMTLRHDGQALTLRPDALAQALPQARPRVLLLLHGLCMHPGQWRRNGHDYGAALAEEANFTLVHLHYNSGRHVSSNALELADRLQALQQAWPVPLQEIAVLAHSMGGLVARSALRQAQERGDAWPPLVQRMFFLGTPHHGAPLERGGHWIDSLLGASPYTAAISRLGKLRSAGITDLRHGSLLDEDWAGADRFAHGHDTRTPVPLPPGVACYAMAGALRHDSDKPHHKLLGDGLVPVDSALGRHKQVLRRLAFEPGRQWVGSGLGHLDLLGHADVAAQLRAWWRMPEPPAAAPPP